MFCSGSQETWNTLCSARTTKLQRRSGWSSVIRKNGGVEAVHHFLLPTQHSCHHSLLSCFTWHHKTKTIKTPALGHRRSPLHWAEQSQISALSASTLTHEILLCWKCWRLRWTLISSSRTGHVPTLHQYVKAALFLCIALLVTAN